MTATRTDARFLAGRLVRTTRTVVPYIVGSLAIIIVAAALAHAQTPTEKPVDQIITSGRNWLIVKGVTLVGAALMAIKSLKSAGGDREGMSGMAKAFGSIVAGLAAVSIINLAQGWMQ